MYLKKVVLLLSMAGLLWVGPIMHASQPQQDGKAKSRDDRRRHGHKKETGTEERRHHGKGAHHHKGKGHHGRDKSQNRDKNHVRKWKGHRKHHGKEGDWKKKWHGGRGFEKHGAHMWNKYGWFWDRDAHSWYQCTPVEDPQRGYGCEYKGTWYPIQKEAVGKKRPGPASSRNPQTVTIEEVDEDIVESAAEPQVAMPVIEDID